MHPWLALNLLFKQDWLLTQRDVPASAFLVLGWKEYATTLGPDFVIAKKNVNILDCSSFSMFSTGADI